MLGSGLDLVTTVIGFGMSATFIVFVCARILCGRIRSADSHASSSSLSFELDSEVDQQERHTISGLEPVLVAAIPTAKYKREDFSCREDALCSICLGEYEEREILRIMPSCRHNFHLACIDVWLQKQPTCPICRLPLNEPFEDQTEGSHQASAAQYNQWLLPRRQPSRGIMENGHEIHEPESVIISLPYSEDQASRA